MNTCSCVQLDRPTREDVECLSKLLATIGQVLDSPRVDNTGRVDKTQTGNAKRTMDTYFQRIQTLSKNNRLESRLRFMLQVSQPRTEPAAIINASRCFCSVLIRPDISDCVAMHAWSYVNNTCSEG